MRIWDIDPGYLNRQSLLAEHRELHGIVSIISNNKKGYSKHPETVRWIGYGWALKQRHKLLSSEMSLRGYKENTPVLMHSNKGAWPGVFVDQPSVQFSILKKKYIKTANGRITLPSTTQQLWAQHKYSVMARDVDLYKSIGKRVSTGGNKVTFQILSGELVDVLRTAPGAGGIKNALLHMWGYVSDLYDGNKTGIADWSPKKLLRELRKLAVLHQNHYVLSSTALGELGAWL